MLRRYPSVTLVYPEGYVLAMQHQYPSIYLLVFHLALLPVYLAPLGSSATSPLSFHRCVHRDFSASKIQVFLLHVQAVIIAHCRLVFPSCVPRDYIAHQCPVSR